MFITPSNYNKIRSKLPVRTTRTSFHSKQLTSKPNSELSHKRPILQNKFNRTALNFSLPGNSQSFQMQNKNFEIKNTELAKNAIKLNMVNHFLILDNLYKTGNLTESTDFHFSKSGYNKTPERKNEKCDVFQILNNCNSEILKNFSKTLKKEINKNDDKKNPTNFQKDLDSAKFQDARKNILEMKKNFFYFEKQKIKKKNNENSLKQNSNIREMYKKHFFRKNMNKLCNLKEFSNYLIQNNERNTKDKEEFLSDEEDNFKPNEKLFKKGVKLMKFPKLEIERAYMKKKGFL